MPKALFSTLVSWSYSVYSQYLKCPRAVCFDKIMKVRIQEPENPHFVKGDRVHGAAEAYISGAGRKPPVPADLAKFAAEVKELRKAKARTEIEWAFTTQWSPTGWFDRDAWLRVKLDACTDSKEPPAVKVVDWKTGKVYEDHKQQRSLYALAGLQLVQIGALAGGAKDTVLTASHLYTDTGFRAEERFPMKRLAPLKREWLARIKEMMADTRFETRVGYHCKYCKFRKSAGGPCPEDR